MPHCLWFDRGVLPRHGSRSQSPERSSSGQQSTSIHILDDDTLFHVFSYCRQTATFDHHEFDDTCASQWSMWEGGFWWYKLVRVCRRWRCLIYGYASHFGVGLPIRGGMQVAGILARTPPLPLDIHHCSHHRISAQEQEDLLLALQHRDRVRAIRLRMQVPDLRTLIVAMGGEFPILECLVIALPIASSFPTSLILPATFHAPRLRRLKLPYSEHSELPILPPSPWLTAPTGLVQLSLLWTHPPTYPCPGTLLQRLSSIPCLEMLQISFDDAMSGAGFEWHWLNPQAMTHVTFPNLRRFTFEGDGNYLEALLLWINSPLLEKLHVYFFLHPTPFPHLSSLGTFGDVGFANVKLTLCAWYISVQVYNHQGGGDLSLIYRDSGPFSQKIAAAGQIINSLWTLLPTVGHLTLRCDPALGLMGPSIEHDRTQWHLLLWPFGIVKTLLVDEGWTAEMSRSLPFRHGETPMDPLPELKELIYCTHQDIVVDAFTKFAEARRKASRPVTLVRHQTSCGW